MTKHVQNLTKVGVICLSKCNVICKCNINMYINIIFHEDINKHGIETRNCVLCDVYSTF